MLQIILLEYASFTAKVKRKIKAIRGHLCAEFTCSLMQVTKAGKTQLMRCDFANIQ